MKANPDEISATPTAPALSTKYHHHDFNRLMNRRGTNIGMLEKQPPSLGVKEEKGEKMLGHYTVVNKIWHYFSVDPGKGCELVDYSWNQLGL